MERLSGKLEACGAPWRAARTPLSSLTDEEFMRMFPPLPALPEALRRTLFVIEAPSNASFPPVWDWRGMNGVTPVRNQHVPQHCGSCYAFAACAELESFIKIYDGRDEDLSEQQVLSCHNPLTPPAGSPGFGGCLGASVDRPYNLFMDPGAVSETCMVYQALDDEVPCIEDECAIHGRISGYSIVAADGNSLKYALLSGPVWVGMYIDSDFRSYGTGCFTYVDPVLPMPDVNHAMLCVGWIDSVCADGGGAWIVKNSFGTAWGDSGYAYIRYGTATFADYAYQIHYIPGPVAALSVKEPDGAEVWAAGSSHRVRWHGASLPVDHFEVGCRIGPDYHVIDSHVAADERQLIWSIPDRPAEGCRVEVAAHDSNDTVIGSDASNAPFAIVTPRVDWDVNGVVVSGAGAWKGAPRIAADDLGGAMLVWQDLRSGNNDIYGQRLDGGGKRGWPPDGYPICVETHHQRRCEIACYGRSALVVWEDERNAVVAGSTLLGSDIYGREMQAEGYEYPLYGEIKICSFEGDQSNPQVIADAQGGAIVVWEDHRTRGAESDLYAQRLHPGGERDWQLNGVPVCAAAGTQHRHRIVSDGAGGAIIAWEDTREGSVGIYAQRIGPDGLVKWGASGLGVCTTSVPKNLQGIVTDALGGAILIWLDSGIGRGWDILAQRVSSSGRILWAVDGIAVCAASEDQYQVDAAPDGAGGALVAWCDDRGEWVGEIPKDLTAGTQDVYAQRIDAAGIGRWIVNGVGVCTLARTQEAPLIVSDGAGGAIVVWRDKRDSGWIDVGEDELGEDEENYDIYVQRVDASGAVMWRENGEPLCAELTEQNNVSMAANPGGSLFVAWNDTRTGYRDIYAQRIMSYCAHPRCSVSASIVRNGVMYPISDTYLFGCPGGDGGDTLLVRCDFRDGDMDGRGTVAPQEITLDTRGLGLALCDATSRDTSGTAGNGYCVTLSRVCITGCSDCEGGGCAERTRLPQDMAVYYGGSVIGAVTGIRVKGLDVNSDGVVNAFESEKLGLLLGCEPADSAYSSAYNYSGDGAIDGDDFKILGAHCAHRCPNTGAPTRIAAITPLFLVKTAAAADTGRQRSVEVFLERIGDVSSICFGLYNESTTLAYDRWIPHPEFGGAVSVAAATRDGRSIIFIAAHRLPTGETAPVEIGTLVYDVIGEGTFAPKGAGLTIGRDNFVLAFGEAITAGGVTASFSRIEYEEENPVCPNHLANCFPNPFNPAATIHYSIAERGRVTLKIFDVSGRLVKTLVDEVQSPATSGHEVLWRGDNNAGVDVSSGVYFCRLATGGFRETRKIVFLK